MAVVAVAVLVVQAGIARLRRKTIRKTVSSGVTRRRDVSRGKPAEFSRVLRVFAERRLPAFISAAASSASLRFGLHLPQHSLSLSLSLSRASNSRGGGKRETRGPARYGLTSVFRGRTRKILSPLSPPLRCIYAEFLRHRA